MQSHTRFVHWAHIVIHNITYHMSRIRTDCTGSATAVYITDTSCNFHSSTFKSDFKSQVNINGSGVSINHGNVQKEAFCLSHQNAPGDASGKSFRGNVSNFTGSCNNQTGALSGTTVAIRDSGYPYLSCDDKVYIDTVGSKTVTDTGGGLVEAQLDNFTTSGACSGITDLGNFKTFKIP